MSASTVCRAKYDFASAGKGQLTLKVGDEFTIVNKTSTDWWTVRSTSGKLGLAPVAYLELSQVGSTPGPFAAPR